MKNYDNHDICLIRQVCSLPFFTLWIVEFKAYRSLPSRLENLNFATVDIFFFALISAICNSGRYWTVLHVYTIGKKIIYKVDRGFFIKEHAFLRLIKEKKLRSYPEIPHWMWQKQRTGACLKDESCTGRSTNKWNTNILYVIQSPLGL